MLHLAPQLCSSCSILSSPRDLKQLYSGGAFAIQADTFLQIQKGREEQRGEVLEGELSYSIGEVESNKNGGGGSVKIFVISWTWGNFPFKIAEHGFLDHN